MPIDSKNGCQRTMVKLLFRTVIHESYNKLKLILVRGQTSTIYLQHLSIADVRVMILPMWKWPSKCSLLGKQPVGVATGLQFVITVSIWSPFAISGKMVRTNPLIANCSGYLTSAGVKISDVPETVLVWYIILYNLMRGIFYIFLSGINMSDLRLTFWFERCVSIRVNGVSQTPKTYQYQRNT